jgi:hypothetical protein
MFYFFINGLVVEQLRTCNFFLSFYYYKIFLIIYFDLQNIHYYRMLNLKSFFFIFIFNDKNTLKKYKNLPKANIYKGKE